MFFNVIYRVIFKTHRTCVQQIANNIIILFGEALEVETAISLKAPEEGTK